MDLPVDELMMDIENGDDDEDREELDWMANVANEGRIEGEVETGNADLPDHMLHHLYYMSKRTIRKKRRNEGRTFPGQF